VSVSVIGNDTYIYYDHWEDGYETDIANPGVGTTLVLANGILGDGCALEYYYPPVACTVDAEDDVDAGDILVFENPIDPTTPLTIDFDGRDKITSSKSTAITRAGHVATPGMLLASAWGDTYDAPVGKNSDVVSKMFKHYSLHALAVVSDTTVSLNGSPVCVNIAEGQACHIPYINEGDEVTTGDANKPVPFHLLTGDIDTDRAPFVDPDARPYVFA